MSGSATSHEQTLAPGTCFGRYRIVRLIGVGGMGAVYQAQHVELNKVVALKTLASTADGRVRLLNEGEAAARIRHRNVVDVYDVGTHDDTVYLVMEYLEGEDLRTYLDRGGTFDSAQLSALLLPLCAALQAAHQQGVVHRDVKPSNVFLAQSTYEEMTPKLLDFGISKLVDQKTKDGEFGTGLLVGTLPYMAPEQAMGARAGGSIDQYSMGVMIYRITTGRLPYPEGASLHELLVQVSQGRYMPPREAFPGIHPGLESVIVRAMARAPEERFESMLELGRALMQFADPRTYDQWRPVFGEPAVRQRTATFHAPPEAAVEAQVPSEAPSWPSSLDGAHSEPLVDRPLWIPVVGVVAVICALLAGIVFGGRLLGASAPPTGRVVAVDSESAPASMDAGLTAVAAPPSPGRAPPPPPVAGPKLPSYRVTVTATPPTARIAVDGRLLGRGKVDEVFTKDGKPHVLTVEAQGYRPRRIEFVDEPPTSAVVLKAVPSTKSRKVSRPHRIVRKKSGPKPEKEPERGTGGAIIIP